MGVKQFCFTPLVFIMEKDLRYAELFDLYQELLTDKQRESFSSHYYYDLSLSEIAEPEGNTRQSVYASLKKVKQKLDEYESKLKLYEKNQRLIELAESLSETQKETAEKIKSIIGK